MHWFAIAVLAVFGVLCSNRLTAEQSLPDVELAKTADLDAKTWGEPAEVEGTSFRTLKAGQRGVVPLNVWWGTGLRPAEGSNALIRITFRDTVTEPIVVQAFAALPGLYELHRIGGLGDGQWKTALVPLPWDLVARQPGTERTEIALQAPSGAEVPVARVQLVRGDPEGDEARWAAETRAWVDRVQSSKRKQAVPRKVDGPAVLPEALKGTPMVPFVRHYVRMLYPDSTPQTGEAGVPLQLTLAQNEIEPAQFGIYAPTAALKDVRVSLASDGFTGANGVKLDARVELLAAEYSVAGDQKLFPQRLWPAYPVSIPAGGTHGFWLTVETSGRTAPGTYRGVLHVEADAQKPVELPVEVHVQPIRLVDMSQAGLHFGACVTGLLPAHEVREMARHNHNSINLWYSGFAPQIIKRSATEFDLDFTVADDWMKHARAAGVHNFVYFLGGDPYGAPDTFNLQRELYRQVHFDGDSMAGRKAFIRKVTASRDAMLPELRALYVQWVKKFMLHAQEAGWPEPLLTPFDEPAKWVQNQNSADIYFYRDHQGQDRVAKVLERDRKRFESELEQNGLRIDQTEHWGKGGAGAWIKPQFKQACAAIHEAWPKARIYASIHHADSGLPFLEDVDVFCTNAIHEDSKLGDKVRAAGPSKTFWQYSGTGDRSEPAQGRYDFGFFFGAYNSRGSLCWAYNWGRRFDTSSGDNWLFAWTTPYGVVRAPYWEGVREAWDDRRYIETLRAESRKAGKENEAEALLQEIFTTAVAQRTAGGRDTVNDFWARTKDPDALDTMRRKIATKIMELQQ